MQKAYAGKDEAMRCPNKEGTKVVSITRVQFSPVHSPWSLEITIISRRADSPSIFIKWWLPCLMSKGRSMGTLPPARSRGEYWPRGLQLGAQRQKRSTSELWVPQPHTGGGAESHRCCGEPWPTERIWMCSGSRLHPGCSWTVWLAMHFYVTKLK